MIKYKKILIIVMLLTATLVNTVAPASAYWSTGYYWSSPSVSYKMDSTLPLGWSLPIYYAKSAWNGAGSSFSFSNDQSSTYKLYYGLIDTRYIALTYFLPNSPGPLTYCATQFNSYFSWTTNGTPGYYDAQNIATHEFGHWLQLGDLSDSGDTEKTMYKSAAVSETKKRSLESDDIAGIISIYP